MSVKHVEVQYRLPCSCGRTVLVDRSQAGLVVTCDCGAQLEVPTIRGLQSLEQVTVERSRSRWGNRQAVLLMGLVIAAVGFGFGAYRQLTPPQLPFTQDDIERDVADGYRAIETMPVEGLWQMWNEMSEGLDRRELRSVVLHQYEVERNTRWMWAMYALGAIGILITASAFLFRP